MALLALSLQGAAQQQNLSNTAKGTGAVLPVPDRPEFKVGDRIQEAAGKFKRKYDITRIGNRGVGGGMNFYSLEKEQRLGRELSMQVEQQSRLVRDKVIEEYVNRLGQNLVRNSDAKVPFTIKVVDNDEVNAFALPGGFFYVNTGLILAAENEAELAGVMAHEIAHVAARHATKNATKNEIWNLASIPLIFIGGPVGYAVQQAAGLAVPMSFLKFNRDAEREADLLGLQYEYASGYDPASFVQFFEKIQARDKDKPNFISKAFSSHPMTADRVRRAQEAIQMMLPPKDEYVVDTSEFQQIKARLSAKLRSRMVDPLTGRPVLHRRGVDGTIPDDRPTLKRRDGRPADSTPRERDTVDDRPTLKRPTD